MARQSADKTREEVLEEARETSDGARLPSGSKTLWKAANWFYGITGHETNSSDWVEENSNDRGGK